MPPQIQSNLQWKCSTPFLFVNLPVLHLQNCAPVIFLFRLLRPFSLSPALLFPVSCDGRDDQADFTAANVKSTSIFASSVLATLELPALPEGWRQWSGRCLVRYISLPYSASRLYKTETQSPPLVGEVVAIHWGLKLISHLLQKNPAGQRWEKLEARNSLMDSHG